MSAKQNFQPALDAAQNQLGLTFSASDSLDTKAIAVLGANIALAIFALQADIDVLVLYLLFLVSSSMTIYVFWPRDYIGAIVDIEKHPEYLETDEEGLVLQLLADTQEAVAINSKLNVKKSWSCIGSIVSGMAGVVVLIACII